MASILGDGFGQFLGLIVALIILFFGRKYLIPASIKEKERNWKAKYGKPVNN
jgi:hypothetical protein